MPGAVSALSMSANAAVPSDLTNKNDLQEAFNLFNQVSRQLSDSYQQLEDRVAHLTAELNSVTAKRMEELAEKERIAERLESLLTVLPGGVVVIDSKGVVSKTNPAAEAMLGEPLEGIAWRKVIERCFRPQQDDGHEISTFDGRRISIATSALAEGGQIILLTDQTETRRLQQELSQHERLSALGQMVSALAHQIRTPLSAAMLYAGHLNSGELSQDKQVSFSAKLLKRLNHMERQVQDMLVFVRGDIPLNDVVTAQELSEGIREEIEVLLQTHRVSAKWLISCPTHQIRCQKDALIGAVMNLVHNALQAGGSGVELSLNMGLLDAEHVVICVSDNGPGIPAELLTQVRDVFVTTKPQGTGLGLAVVDNVCKQHGGRFVLSSEVGRGTDASIVLPLAQLVRTPSSELGVKHVASC